MGVPSHVPKAGHGAPKFMDGDLGRPPTPEDGWQFMEEGAAGLAPARSSR